MVAALDLETLLAAGIRDVEEATYRTWLGADSTVTRRFNPPTNSAVLRIDDLAAFTSLTYQTLGGTASTLTQDTDFVLEPVNAAADSRPYTRVRFTWHRWQAPLALSQRGAIRLTGKWGFSVITTGWGMPEPVWVAMLSRSAWHAWNQLTHKTTGGRMSYRDDDVAEEFGVERWTGLRDMWEGQYRSGISPVYARLDL